MPIQRSHDDRVRHGILFLQLELRDLDLSIYGCELLVRLLKRVASLAQFQLLLMAQNYVPWRYHLFDYVALRCHALDVGALLLPLVLELLDYVLHVVDLGRLVHDLLA